MKRWEVDQHIQISLSVINIVVVGEGDTIFVIFLTKLTVCMVNMATIFNGILGKMEVFKKWVVDLHMRTKFVIKSVVNIVEMEEALSFFFTILEFVHKINHKYGCHGYEGNQISHT